MTCRAKRRAVIPIAGLGTRFFPSSHAVRKELFPIVCPDGVARPLLHVQLKDLEDAGFDAICLIVEPGGEEAIRRYFRGPGEDSRRRMDRIPGAREDMARMLAWQDTVSFAVQREREGYGHAVYQARSFADGNPVLVCLGDHLFRGNPAPARRLADTHAKAGGGSVSAVNRIGPAELGGYGVIAGARRPNQPELIEVSKIVEKPDLATARRDLRVDDLPADAYLGWFGMHLLNPSIFDVLERMIREDLRDRGEFQLTRAQDLQREAEGYAALEMSDALRFDFGIPDDYLRSLVDYCRPPPTQPVAAVDIQTPIF